MSTVRAQGGAEPPAALAYNIGASTPDGLWLGLTAPALALLAAGLLLSILAALTGLPFGIALIPILLTATAALLPLAGRPVYGWAGPAAGYAGSGLGPRRWCPPLAGTLLREPSPGQSGRAGLDIPVLAEVGRARLRLPAEYGRPVLIGLVPAADLGPDVTADSWAEPTAVLVGDRLGCDGPGVLLDRPAGVVTLVFAVAGLDRFALLDPAEQDRLLAGWGSALTLLSRDPAMRRVQLLDRRVPHAARRSASRRAGEVTQGLADSPRDADYQQLQDRVRSLTVQRDSLLAVQLRLDAFIPSGTARGRVGAVQRPGQRHRHDVAILTAARERAQHLSTQLLAGQLLSRPLGPNELTSSLAGLLSCQPAAAGPAAPCWGSDPAQDVPLIGSRRSAWDHVRVDDTWHRSYAITGWPRTPSPGSWLTPLLLTGPAGPEGTFATTFSVHLEPIPPGQAARLARSARTRADLDLADRRKLGLPPSAAADLIAEGAAGMDAELVAGHSAHRLAALLTVAAPSLTELETASRQLQEAALACRLQVRPLHGQHHLALAASLPLCRLRSSSPS